MKELEWAQGFPHYNPVVMETRVLIQSGPKPYAAIPHPNDAPDEI